MPDRLTPPVCGEFDSFSLPKASTTSLDNGIPFHQILSGSQSVIRLEIIFKAGTWYENKTHSSYLTSKMLSEGTSNHSAKEIEEQIAFYGAFLEITPGNDKVTVCLYTLSKYLPELCPLLFEIIAAPSFPDRELNNLKNITIQNLKINQKKTSYLASVRFREILFSTQHPYGRCLSEANITAASKEDLRDFHDSFFHYGNCDIILSGNGEGNFFQIINDFFGKEKWGGSGAPRKKDPEKVSGTEKKSFIEVPESMQSSIRTGLSLFTIGHPDYFKVNILTEILGGYFGSRLMKNIREDKGYTYGIHASLVCLRNAGYMVIGTDVNKENTSDTIREIFKETDLLRKEMVSDQELFSVKNYLLGSFVNSLNTPFALADKFKTIYFNGLGYEFYDQYIDCVKTISPAEIQRTAEKYFIRENFYEVVAGGK